MRQISDETRQKMSIAKRGNKNPRAMLGKHHSKESRELMSKMAKKRFKEKPVSKDTKQKMRITALKHFKEHPISEETKQKMSKIRKEWHKTHRTGKLITYKGKTQNIKEWAEELGIKYETLKQRLYIMDFERAISARR